MTSLFGKSTVQDLLHKELPSHPTSLPSFSCLSTFSNHASHSCSPTFLSHRSSSVWTSNTTSRLDNPANIYGSLQGNIATTKKAHTHTRTLTHIIKMSFANTSPLTGFLQLAPATSNSYPQVQRSQQPKTEAEPAAAAAAVPAESNAATASPQPVQRRSSSLSSSSSNDGMRFLKLGPVHWGEHMEDHQGDFAVE